MVRVLGVGGFVIGCWGVMRGVRDKVRVRVSVRIRVMVRVRARI